MPTDQDKQHSTGPISRSHPTGADYRLYVTDGTEPSAPFEQSVRASSEQELDASSMMLTSEDSLIPLYDWNDKYAKLASYGKGLVSGQIQINFSEAWLRTWRRERLQGLWGKTLWIISSYIDWAGPSIVRETTKVGPIFPRPFRHDPAEAGYAQETITFMARRAAMVGVQRAAISSRGIEAFVDESQSVSAETRELIRSEEEEFFARIYTRAKEESLGFDFGEHESRGRAEGRAGTPRRTYVIDADTVWTHVLARPGRALANVRLLGVDAPEALKPAIGDDGYPKPGQFKGYLKATRDNEADRADFQWPNGAPTLTEPEGEMTYDQGQEARWWGQARRSPDGDQLTEWGTVAGEYTRQLLQGSGQFRLIRVPGSGTQGTYGRELFRIRTPSGNDLGVELIERGLALPSGDGLAELEGGTYQSYNYRLEEAFRRARHKCKDGEGEGVWSAFTPKHPDAVLPPGVQWPPAGISEWDPQSF